MTTRPVYVALLAASLALAGGPSKAAGAAGAAGAEPRRALAFALSGGVSLGAYEAGFLHYALAATRANPGIVDLRLVTGTSAGSVNGILAVLEACGDPEAKGAAHARPGDGLFWRTWIPLGLAALSSEPPTALAAFTRRSLVAASEEIRRAWERGLDPACDVVLGAAITRVAPRPVAAPGGLLTMPRVEEKLALRITGRGPGRPPRVENYLDPTYPLPQLLLPEGPDGAVGFEALRSLLLASTSFPIAFAPVPVRHCEHQAGVAWTAACPEERATEALFVDGGVLDNAPLRFAARLAGAGLRDDGAGGTHWGARPLLGAVHHLPDATLFAYLSADVAAWPEAALGDPAPPTSLVPLVQALAKGFVSTARAKELVTLLEEHPEIHGRLFVPARHLPAASSPLAAFLGFVEREFRVFDFYLGMYDARRLLTDRIAPDLAFRGREPVVFPEVWTAAGAEAETGPEAAGGWRPLACLRGVFDGDAALAAACDHPALVDFRILLQVSLDRLYSDCAPAAGRDALPPTDHAHCAAATAGAAPPRVPGVDTAGRVAWRRRAGEDETPHALRLLAAHRFRFRDLGLDRDEADEALRTIRRRVGALAMDLAWAQPAPPERGIVAVAGALALNTIAYAPPRHLVWATLGRDLELGWSRELPPVRRLPDARLQGTFRVVRLSDAMSSDPQRIAFAGAAGLELIPSGLSDFRLQTSFAARLGWLASLEDDFGARPCAAPDTIGRCSGPFVQAVVALTAIERIRLQLGWEYHLPVNRRPGGLWAVTPGLGFQITF